MKVFISMPMSGKTREEIIKRRNEIANILTLRFPDQTITIIDSLVDSVDVGPVWCLGYSIQKMEDADLIVFDKGWRDARGCKVEYDVCSYYGFKFLEI